MANHWSLLGDYTFNISVQVRIRRAVGEHNPGCYKNDGATMKRLSLIIAMSLLVVIITCFKVAVVSAHELETNNNVSVVMHIPPSDNPEANQRTMLNFFFGNDSSSFRLEDYTVEAHVGIDSNFVQVSPVVPAYSGANVDGVAFVTFPKVGTYKIELVGTDQKNRRQDFVVEYVVNVDRSATGDGQTTKNKSGTVILFGSTVLVAVIMLAIQQIIDGRRYEHRRHQRMMRK